MGVAGGVGAALLAYLLAHAVWLAVVRRRSARLHPLAWRVHARLLLQLNDLAGAEGAALVAAVEQLRRLPALALLPEDECAARIAAAMEHANVFAWRQPLIAAALCPHACFRARHLDVGALVVSAEALRQHASGAAAEAPSGSTVSFETVRA